MNAVRGSKGTKHSNRFYAFLVVYLVVGSYVFINVLNLQFWPFNYVNPPETTPILFRTLEYPSPIFYSPYTKIGVEVSLATNMSLAEEVPVLMSAYATSVDFSYVEQISEVLVGFMGSNLYSPPSAPPIQTGNVLFPYIALQSADLAYGNQLSQMIVWHSQGDYAPFMVIRFKNATEIDETYPNLSVHVNSADVARSERYNRVNEALSLSLVLFGFVEGYGILQEIDEKRNRRKTPKKAKTINERLWAWLERGI